MRVHSFGYGVRMPSPQGLASGGNSRGGEASAAAQPVMGGRSMWHDRRCFGRLEQEDQRLQALRPLDGHRTVTGARIIHID